MNDAAHPDVRPDGRRLRMAFEEIAYLREVHGLRIRLRKRHVDVAVEDHDEADLSRKVENAVERRVGEAGGFAGDLRGDELLVNREFADAREHAWERLQDALDVIGRVH